jgi:gamma-glutamyltranspeptidase/glutathione hydrolase
VAGALGGQSPVEPLQPVEPPRRAVAVGTGGAIATVDPVASEAGMAVLRRGGNAVDAAVAAAAVLGVTEPYSCGIGGGGFLVAYLADNRRVVTIDHRETAPAGLGPDAFVDPVTGSAYPHEELVTSGLGVGVPGTVAGWAEALERYGTIDLDEALAPAVAAARQGFVVDPTFTAQTEANRERFARFPSTRTLFLTREGRAPPAGAVLRNPDLAETLERIGEGGSKAFYSGPLAADIVETVRRPPLGAAAAEPPVRPGVMIEDDLSAYKARPRPPVRTRYRGYEITGMGPPSSGGSTVGEALEILEGFNLAALPRTDALHRMLEASRLAFADRNAFLGDPDYIAVPLDRLLSEPYAAGRRRLIGPMAGQSPAPAGDPRPQETTHLTVADRAGNVVSYTFTIEEIGGSGMVVPGRGFLLNNELTDFDKVPPHPNAPAGGKRPRSSMAPTIVLRQGRPVLALGSPGGSTIITTVLGLLVEVLDFGRSLPEAIAVPRASQRDTPDTLAEPAFSGSLGGGLLQGIGHRFMPRDEIGAVTGIAFLPGGTVVAAAEPGRRGGGSALVEQPQRPGRS